DQGRTAPRRSRIGGQPEVSLRPPAGGRANPGGSMSDYTSDYSTEPEAGGVGTLQRPAAPRVPTRRTTRPRPDRLTGDRADGVILAPRTIPRPQRAAGEVAPRGARRMPFIVLLCGLLGGALISALVISTTLAAG